MKRRVLWFVVCVAMIVSVLVMPVNALASSKAKYMKTTENVHLRDEDDIYDIIGTIKKNKEVYFTGKKKGNFYLVQTKDGRTGYVFKMYLTDSTAKTKGTVYRVQSDTKLYKHQRVGKKVCSLYAGQYVKVAWISDGWAYAMNVKGKVGYVQASNLKKA